MVKRHYEIALGKMLCSNALADDYTYEKYFCAADVHFGSLNTTANKQMWFSPSEKEECKVKDGDLLIVEGGAGAGNACVAEGLDGDYYIQNSILRLRGLRGNRERFLCYLIESLVRRGYVDMVCNKATIPHFTKEKVGDVPIALPSYVEQEEIVEYLDRKCGKVDEIIAKRKVQLEKLAEYKKSLIYEYVTGKKEVAA